MGACPRVEPVPSEGRGGDIGIVPVGYRQCNVGIGMPIPYGV